MGQNQWYHFGVGAPPILVYFSGDGVRDFDPQPYGLFSYLGSHLTRAERIWPVGGFGWRTCRNPGGCGDEAGLGSGLLVVGPEQNKRVFPLVLFLETKSSLRQFKRPSLVLGDTQYGSPYFPFKPFRAGAFKRSSLVLRSSLGPFWYCFSGAKIGSWGQFSFSFAGGGRAMARRGCGIIMDPLASQKSYGD